jgi:glycosyltransferase involved in cell wall biosynthesis
MKVGLIAEPDTESLADAIELYFSKGEDAFIPGIIEEKKKYSWDVMTREILNV